MTMVNDTKLPEMSLSLLMRIYKKQNVLYVFLAVVKGEDKVSFVGR